MAYHLAAKPSASDIRWVHPHQHAPEIMEQELLLFNNPEIGT